MLEERLHSAEHLRLGSRFLAGTEAILPLAMVKTLSPTALAYLGDAVYELFVRTENILPPTRPRDYHQRVVAYVRAETQAKLVRQLDLQFTETEKLILKQGRNASSGCPKRLDPNIYRQATAFETLVGYLYLTDTERLCELLSFVAGSGDLQA